MSYRSYQDALLEIHDIGLENLEAACLLGVEKDPELKDTFGKLALMSDQEINEMLSIPEGLSDTKVCVTDVINLHERPVLDVKLDVNKQTFSIPQSPFLSEKLSTSKGLIENAIASTGRIDTKGHPTLNWIGTAWRVSDDFVVTNMHVAEHVIDRIKKGDEVTFSFKKNPSHEEEIITLVDFSENGSGFVKTRLIECIWMPDSPVEKKDDIAIFRMEPGEAIYSSLGNTIELSSSIKENTDIAVIGFPNKYSGIFFPKVIHDIFNNTYEVKKVSPGKIISFDNNVFTHDASTLPGYSGSPVVELNTGNLIGMHTEGTFGSENFAIRSVVIGNLLADLGVI